jgi:hypothetical protein
MAKKESDYTGFTPTSQRRYYLDGLDVYQRGIDDLRFVNEHEVMPPYEQRFGRHPNHKGGPPSLGLVPLLGLPRVIHKKTSRTQLDYYRMNVPSTIVSDRMRKLLEEIDSAAFEWDEVHVTHGEDEPMALGPYWRMDVIRVIEDCLNHDKSELKLQFFEGYEQPSYIGITSITVIPEAIGDAHAFCLRGGKGPIWDDTIVDEIRKRKYLGMSFTPLQTPTYDETVHSFKGITLTQWRDVGPVKEYWDDIKRDSERRYREKLAREQK